MKMPWSKSEPEPSGASAVTASEPRRSASPVVEERRDPTAPKGRPTPKRSEAQRSRGPVAPPPATGKEARQRMREQAAERKAAGLPPERPSRLSAREERLQARDAGPERALVRNIVDSRRSLSSLFPILAIALLIAMIAGLPTKNPQLYNYISLAWVAFFVVIVVESLFLGKVIGTAVRQRFPKTELRLGSLRYYGILRNLMVRRMRYPKPAIAPGEDY